MRQRVGTNVCGNLSKRPQQSQLLFEFQSPGYPCWEMRAGRSRDWSLFICTCPYCSLKGSSNPIKALCSKKKWFLSCTPFVGPASPSPSMSKNSITRPLTTSWTAWSFDQPCETFFWEFVSHIPLVGLYSYKRQRGSICFDTQAKVINITTDSNDAVAPWQHIQGGLLGTTLSTLMFWKPGHNLGHCFVTVLQ